MIMQAVRCDLTGLAAQFSDGKRVRDVYTLCAMQIDAFTSFYLYALYKSMFYLLTYDNKSAVAQSRFMP